MDPNAIFVCGLCASLVAGVFIGRTTARQAAGPAEKTPDAVQLLNTLQEKGRLIDFLMEDIKGYDDAQVGAAVRNIHSGCRQVLSEHFPLAPVVREAEGDKYKVDENFDPASVKLTGNIGKKPPFDGVVRHSGWKVTEIKLPVRPSAGRIVAQAEVEIM